MILSYEDAALNQQIPRKNQSDIEAVVNLAAKPTSLEMKMANGSTIAGLKQRGIQRTDSDPQICKVTNAFVRSG